MHLVEQVICISRDEIDGQDPQRAVMFGNREPMPTYEKVTFASALRYAVQSPERVANLFGLLQSRESSKFFIEIVLHIDTYYFWRIPVACIIRV